MRVPKDAWIDMHIKTPISTWQTWGFVRANYCDTMTAKSLCPKKCWECEPGLKEAIEKLNRPDIEKPIGLLIYALRELVAKMQEKFHPEGPVERDRYESQKDPFQTFMEDLK
jgi:hypothetical protein